MMNWHELHQLARERFKVAHASIPMLLVAWAESEPNDDLSGLVASHGLDVRSLAAAMQAMCAENDTGDKTLLTDCIMRAGDAQPTVKHILETLCNRPEHRITQKLAQAGLDVDGLRRRLADSSARHPPVSTLARLGIAVDANASPLLKYGRDVTGLSKDGWFDGYCTRPDELESVVTVLMRMERANPALTGEAGVGKTALVELLAREIVSGRIVGIDPKTRIFEVSIGKLLAGTRYRGDFEERVQEVVGAVLKSAPAFLFLDEAHLLFGAGRAEGAPMDMANFLKPFLARGDLRVIAATTEDEYNRYIAQDEALARRFEQVRIPEPDRELTNRMVQARARSLAAHHGIEIPEDMVVRATQLTNEHLPQKLQPYKSIDLLDMAACKARQLGKHAIDEDMLIQVLAKSTGRDIEQLKGEDRKALRDLPEFLKTRIIGQDGAIDKVVATVVRQRQKLGATERNLGTFLFVGPTGVGKTELARQLAHGLFGTTRALQHLDMAEYAEPGGIHKLIGAPDGFVGSEREGTLIRWLQNHPAGGVLLFDEIEKAHREIHNLLLGALDNGRLHSARGKPLDCRHCVVILTSNAISAADLNRGPLGFGEEQRRVDPSKLLTKDFPAEFLGRLDDIILFNALGDADVERIARLRLEEALARLRKRGVQLRGDLDRLSRHLARKLTATSGARGIERLIEQAFLEPIALATLRIDEDGDVEAEVNDDFYNHGHVHVRTAKEQS
jgi:ATP-dependent Clp protease ATP-binding subunit ClpC